MRKSMIGAVVAAMALGGAGVALGDSSTKSVGDADAAIAVAGGPPMLFTGGPPMLFTEGPDGTFAEDLAAELDLSVEEVERALEAVKDKQLSEHRRELAEAISSELEGVSVDEVESALAVADERMREAFESGEPPPPDVFAETLADELGLSEDEIADALEAAREASFEAHRDQMEQRLDDAVESGRLSEKEADAIRERLDSVPPKLEFRSEPGEVRPDGPPLIGARPPWPVG
jgi:transcriptional regulator with XRE-family HTH domain